MSVNDLSTYKMHSVAQLSIKDLEAYSHCAQLSRVCADDFPIDHCRIQCAKRIIRKAENLNFLIPSDKLMDKTDMQGSTMLHVAVMGTRSTCEILEDLMNLGADFAIKNKHGDTALHCAFKSYSSKSDENQDNSFINCILSAHVKFVHPLNPCDNNGLSHFHIACMVNNAEVVEFFLQNGADVNQVVSKEAEQYPGFTPLHCAVNGRSIQAVEVLLKYGADINIRDSFSMTPLHQVLNQKMELSGSGFKFTREEQVRRVLEDRLQLFDTAVLMLLGCDFHDKIDIIDSTGLSSFHVACIMQDPLKVEKLLEKVKDIDHCVNMNSPMWPGYTALHFAAHCNTITMKILHSKGANIDVKNAKGLTPIDICIESGHMEDIHAAVSLKPEWAEILFSDNKTTLKKFLSVMRDTTQLSNFLDTSVVDINMTLPIDSPLWPGSTPLHLAVSVSKTYRCPTKPQYATEESNLKQIEELLNHGADVTRKDAKGSTPLHHTFRENKIQASRLLREHHRSSANPTDEDNLSHLHIACAEDDENLVEKILSGNDVDVNVCFRGEKSVQGIEPDSTPLNCIFSYGTKIKRMLIQQGAIKSLSTERIVAQALHSECTKGDKAAVQWLLDRGVDVNAAMDDGSTSLHIALMFGVSQEVVDLLLQRGADLLAKDKDGNTPLRWAFCQYQSHRSNVYRRLIIPILQQQEELQERTERETGITMLHIACFMLDVEEVKKQLERGVKVDARVHKDSKLWPSCTALHVLMIKARFWKEEALSDVNVISNLLLEKGADVTLADAETYTPIHMLCERAGDDSAETIELLFKYQRDFRINPSSHCGFTHFHVAIIKNNVEVVEKFLEHGVDVNLACDFDGSSAGCLPLHMALNSVEELADTRIVDLLLSHGADVSLEDDRGRASIHVALRAGPLRLHLIEKLLSYGADINSQDIEGCTPLETLLQPYDPDAVATAEDVRFFLQRGCRVNVYNPVTGEGYLGAIFVHCDVEHRDLLLEEAMKAPDAATIDEMGRTIFHNIAAVGGVAISSEEYAKLFDRFKGCDVDDQDHAGRTALHIAAMFGNDKAISALLNMGADLNIVDSQGKSAFSYAVDFCVKYGGTDRADEYKQHEVLWTLFATIQLLKYFGSEVSQLNNDLIIPSSIILDYTDFDVYEDIEDLRPQLEAAKSFTIGELSLTLGDFLSEANGVVKYSQMSEESRRVIDEVFGSIGTEFETILPILKLQHRNAVTRFQLVEKISLTDLVGFLLPALCADNILRFLSIADLKNVVAAVNYQV